MTRLTATNGPTSGGTTVRADIIVQEQFRTQFSQLVATACGAPSWMSLPGTRPTLDVRWEDVVRASQESSLAFLAGEPDLYDDSDGEPV